ncbi:hypothetical protein CROQUDRAFT_516714 [Cronartium quercuum f. sp. fusiforme G11]|uniref:Uncharacterized protein n=1 Tax=Cronartium quercuum f. sp. fusiforme G11 TaxID=708437 RepID=A0A9P6NMZ7_9BASI|nr:hypothetical protein CROQUDRAFT_516714 [Cronartium quercuum f. sp. fusiforme G11]
MIRVRCLFLIQVCDLRTSSFPSHKFVPSQTLCFPTKTFQRQKKNLESDDCSILPFFFCNRPFWISKRTSGTTLRNRTSGFK